MARELTGPKYLREFKCIGPDCEDSCCVEWTIPVDPDGYQRMKKAMRKTAADRAKLKQSIQRDKSAQDGTTQITIKTPNDRCAFLDEDCLCSLQKRFGEQVLPQACALFPRVVRRVGEAVEMGASMAAQRPRGCVCSTRTALRWCRCPPIESQGLLVSAMDGVFSRRRACTNRPTL
jgi:lysine-N-methylase